MATNTPVVPGNGPKSGQDPTALTIQALLREIEQLRELQETSQRGLTEKIETRLDAMDKALQLLQVKADKVPSETDIAVARLQALHEEKFKGESAIRSLGFEGVKTQFAERDDRVKEGAVNIKAAVDTAFASQKEAITKTEVGFTKQIDQMGERQSISMKATDDKIDDLKDRLTSIESYAKGVGGLWGYIVGGVGLAAAVVVLVAKM